MSDPPLDIRCRKLGLDGVLNAIQAESIRTGGYPDELIISPEQDQALVAELAVWAAADEPPPQSLAGETLWGLSVRVEAKP